MANAVANSQNVAAALADYNVLRPQKSGTDTMAAITQKYGTDVADAVRAQVAAGTAPAPTAPAGSGPAAGAYGFSLTSPSATSSAQGDLPRNAPPGADNTRYSTLDQQNQANGTQVPLVAWNAGPAFSTPGLAGLSQLASYARSGGTTYYSLSSAWQAYVDMPLDQRMAVQQQLLASGKYSAAYYPSGTTPATQRPVPGAVGDHDTFLAFSQAFNAAMYAGIPLERVLSSPDAAAQNAAQVWQQNTQVGQVTQTSPEEIQATADAQAVAILGRKATADEKALITSIIQGKEVAEGRAAFDQKVAANRSDLAVSLAGGIGAPLGGATGASIAGGGSPASVNALVSALGGQETTSPTAGGYGAVNPDSGATGRFQILPDNWTGRNGWNGWAAAAGLPPGAPMTPQNQEIVARNQISLYLKDGNGDASYVAVAWYAGEETAKAFQADPSNAKWQKPQMSNGKKYPSIADYAKSVVGKMATATPGTLATQSMAGQAGNLPADTGSTAASGGTTYGSTDPNYPYPTSTGSTAAAGAIGGANPTAPIIQGQSAKGGTVPFGPGLDTQGRPIPGATGTPAPGSTSGQPTLDQLLPTSFGVYTSVNPTAEAAAALRRNNPQGAGAHDIATVLDAVHALFHGSGS